MTESKTNTVGIVGGGIVGTATALSLARMGYATTIIDPQVPGRAASWGNAGTLNPSSIVPVNFPGLIGKVPRMLMDPNSPLFLDWRYFPTLLPWIIRYLSHCRRSEALHIGEGLAALLEDCPNEHKRLARGTAASQFLNETELDFVYNNRASFDADSFGWSMRRKFGIDWDTIEGKAYKEMEPAIASDSCFVVRLPGHGVVSDPGRYVDALTDSFKELGGIALQDEVVEFDLNDGSAGVILESKKRIEFSTLVIAAGAWSGRLTRKLGLTVPLESERGYHVEYINPSIMPKRPMMFAADKFVATPMDGRLRCGGLVEFGGLDMPPSSAPIDLIKRQVQKVFPDLRCERIETWQGHRPALTDSLPIIDTLPNNENVVLAFGHHHIGLAAGAKTGRVVADLIAGNESGFDLTPYRADRFRGW
jgi:D-amino-acid dehydrogenase